MLPDFCWQRSADHVKFTEECGMYTEKHILVKKNVYKRAKHEELAVCKEGHADSILGHERTHYY